MRSPSFWWWFWCTISITSQSFDGMFDDRKSANVSYELSWHVSIRYFDGEKMYHVCSGAIIQRTLILTAAYCVDLGQQFNESNFKVVVGTGWKNETDPNNVYDVGYIQINSKWNNDTFQFNSALVYLLQPLNFDDPNSHRPLVQRIRRASSLIPWQNKQAYIDTWDWTGVTDYSQTYSTKLNYLNDCKQYLEPLGYYLDEDNEICINTTEGACPFDNGALLRLEDHGNWYLLGTASWMIERESICSQHCAVPMVFTNISVPFNLFPTNDFQYGLDD